MTTWKASLYNLIPVKNIFWYLTPAKSEKIIASCIMWQLSYCWKYTKMMNMKINLPQLPTSWDSLLWCRVILLLITFQLDFSEIGDIFDYLHFDVWQFRHFSVSKLLKNLICFDFWQFDVSPIRYFWRIWRLCRLLDIFDIWQVSHFFLIFYISRIFQFWHFGRFWNSEIFLTFLTVWRHFFSPHKLATLLRAHPNEDRIVSATNLHA